MSDDGTRFQIEFSHGGSNTMWGYRVRDLETGETNGSGLTYDHAVRIAVQMAEAAGVDPWRRHIDADDA